MPPWAGLLGNVVGFQVVWFASVLGAAAGYWWVGPAALVVFAALQLTLKSFPREWLLVGVVGVLGFFVDTAYLAAGLIEFESPGPLDWGAPPWIVAMWMNFALTLNHAMAFLRDRPIVGIILGAIGGPLAYAAGDKLGAAALPDYWLGLAVIGIAWAIAVPVCMTLAQRICKPEAQT